jgi:hypothetical protein
LPIIEYEEDDLVIRWMRRSRKKCIDYFGLKRRNTYRGLCREKEVRACDVCMYYVEDDEWE